MKVSDFVGILIVSVALIVGVVWALEMGFGTPW